MKNTIKWLENNNYDYSTDKLQNGGMCIFINIHQITRDNENKLITFKNYERRNK